MHTHGATTGSIGVFNGIGGCFTDCDEQVSSREVFGRVMLSV